MLAEQEPTTAVHKDALVTFAGMEKIFLVNDGKAVEKNVATGRRAGEFIEIASGVKAGDVVVVSPGSLQNGQPVTVEQSAVSGQRSAKTGEPSADSKQRSSKGEQSGKQGKPAGP